MVKYDYYDYYYDAKLTIIAPTKTNRHEVTRDLRSPVLAAAMFVPRSEGAEALHAAAALLLLREVPAPSVTHIRWGKSMTYASSAPAAPPPLLSSSCRYLPQVLQIFTGGTTVTHAPPPAWPSSWKEDAPAW
jgi:hypothetical protein